MDTLIKRKEFQKMFLPNNENGTQIWVITRVKGLPIEIIKMAISLAKLDFIKYIQLTDEGFQASNQNYPKRPKVPNVHSVDDTATGIDILYSLEYKGIEFFDICSPIDLNRNKMVKAVLSELPNDWDASSALGWHGDLWEEMEKEHKNVNWNLY